MARTLLVLLRAEVLRSVRARWLVRSMPRFLGMRSAFALQAGAAIAFAILFYVAPMVLLDAPTLPSATTRSTLQLAVNVASALFVLFGLFCGAYLVCGHVVLENEGMLAYPITLRELARPGLGVPGGLAGLATLVSIATFSGLAARDGLRRADRLAGE